MEIPNTSVLFSAAEAGIEPGWRAFLERTGLLARAQRILLDIEKKYFASKSKIPISSIICPPADQIFAFARFPFADTRIVIVGQDPYPKRKNAHGLAFSVPDGIPVPASLNNIFAALVAQKLMRPYNTAKQSGNLECWARQGVVLLNTALTTIEHKSGEHMDLWKDFAQLMVAEIAKALPGTFYFLFGAPAQRLARQIPTSCAIYQWCHPSPLSAANRDPDCAQHFKRCNAFLLANNALASAGKKQIVWDPNEPLVPVNKEVQASDDRKAPRAREILLDIDDDLVCPRDDMIFAFVDGAATGNGAQNAAASYAVIIVNTATAYEIAGRVPGDLQTNNRGELMALHEMFAFMASEDFICANGSLPVTIVYDSAYAAGCLQTWYEQWCKVPPSTVKANLDIIAPAHDFMKRVACARKIIWEHVRSHIKEPSPEDAIAWYKWYGNMRVDMLAQGVIRGS